MIAYRGDSEYSVPSGTTILDVINYEVGELGNNLPYINHDFLAKYGHVPARYAIWVCYTADAAQVYVHDGEDFDDDEYEGEVSEEIIPDNHVVIAEDGQDGYFVLGVELVDLKQQN